MATQQSTIFTRILIFVLGVLFIVSLSWLLYGNYQAGDSASWQLLISGILLSIPLALLYSSIGVLLMAARQKSTQGQVDRRLAKLLFWSPRLAGVAIIFFISLFALDVFAPGYSLGEMLLGFLMHMLPSIALAVVLAFAWRWEWVGFAAFLAAALFFMRFLLRNPVQEFGNFLLFSAPLLVIALLFGANWLWRKELHPAS